jgi:hypothetical protein
VGDPVPDAIHISSAARIVIVEGNYTLLNEKPWNRIAALVDERLVRSTFVKDIANTTSGGLSMSPPMWLASD